MKYIYYLFLASIIACNSNLEIKKESSMQVMYSVFDKIDEFTEPQLGFPPPPVDENGNEIYFTSKNDSLKMCEIYYKLKNSKKIVAVRGKFIPSMSENISLIESCPSFKELSVKLRKSNDSISIDLSKITFNKRNSLVYYKSNFLTKGTRDFKQVDFVISLSPLVFNANYTKAMIVVSVSTSTLAGATQIFCLEKKNYIWQVVCIQGLSIS